MPPPLDEAVAHKWFSGRCFNATWDYLDKPSRTDDEDRQMLLTAMASLWHWTQRPDAGDQQWSVGCWLISRVYAIAGDTLNARAWAETCHARSGALSPFYQGYACEALARAAKLAGDKASWGDWRAQARQLAEQVESAEERTLLEKDLAEL